MFTSNPNASCLDTTNSTIEFFSSQGPTIDGRMKPDVVGIDGVAISGAGSFGTTFFGTSAAAPHVAGIAALAAHPAVHASARAEAGGFGGNKTGRVMSHVTSGPRPRATGSAVLSLRRAVLSLVLTGGAWQWSASKNSRLNVINALDPDSGDIRDPGGQYGDENFLIVGIDSRAGDNANMGADDTQDADGARSDTVMLVNIPANRKRVVAVSGQETSLSRRARRALARR